WFYQAIAKSVGKKRYTEYLKVMNYGNAKPGPELTTFWLRGGDLKITPFEQVTFLKNIYLRQLNLTKKSYDVLKEIMLEENHQDYQLYTKTGAATKNWNGHGWYIGYIETNEQVWFFATNILIHHDSELKLRKEITLACLHAKGILSKLREDS